MEWVGGGLLWRPALRWGESGAARGGTLEVRQQRSHTNHAPRQAVSARR